MIGCASTNNKEELSERENDLLNFIELMQIVKGPEYHRLCKKIVNDYGVEALPMLSEHTSSNSTLIRIGCIFCMGEIYREQNPNAVLKYRPVIASRLQDQSPKVQMEAASVLCEMKDYRGVPILISALRAKEPYVRKIAKRVLFSSFNLTFSYDHNDPLEDREKRVDQWEEWWSQNKDKLIKAS